jgi:aerobic-type carbon monoxide dehydrogenase small subunit (CoxS/CutS family)
MNRFTLSINRQRYTESVAPGIRRLWVLRNQLALTGTINTIAVSGDVAHAPFASCRFASISSQWQCS